MDGQVLIFPKGNDIQVTARFPGISDGTGAHSEFYYKDNRYVADNDPGTMIYSSAIDPDPDNPGATMSTFHIPAADNVVTGAFWYRVDAVDSLNTRRTTACGTLLVEAVLWSRKARRECAAQKGSCTTGPRAKAEQKSTGECPATLIAAW